MSGFEAFDIQILAGPDERLWVSARSDHGAVYGIPRSGDSLAGPEELAELTEDFEDAIVYARPQRGLDIGAALRDIVFGEPEVLALLHRSRGAAAHEGNQLLIRLLAAPWQLAAVPWELLLDPDGGAHQFLTLAPDAHVVRAARSRIYPVPTQPLTAPVNVLLILSSPMISAATGDDSYTFDLFEEKRNQMMELLPLRDEGLLQIDVEEHPSMENLRRRIGSRKEGYHVVHYIGHADPSGLILEDPLGRSAHVPVETFNDLLRQCPQLRLALFAGCETARGISSAGERLPQGEWLRGLSMADRCVRESCPTVIGMREKLPFRTEWLFTRFFYQNLATGSSIAHAVRLARAAVRGDPYVGGQLLDWAVPSVIVSGDSPGVLIGSRGTAMRPPASKPRAELKLNLEESDRDFFSRLISLRTTVDVLAGRSGERVLSIIGAEGVGKTSLIDRALDDLGNAVHCVLYFRVSDLLASAEGDPEPVLRLCGWVAELLTQHDGLPRERPDGMAPSEWWDRLAAQAVKVRFVIVIDDVQNLDEPSNQGMADELGEALRKLTDKRGDCRLALCGTAIPERLRQKIRVRMARVTLLPFAWDEVWRWVRRNLPVLTRYGKAPLSEHYSILGNDLELWRRLAHAVTARGQGDLHALVAQVAPPKRPVAATAGQIAPRERRALRVAVAGPHMKGPEEFAAVVTRLGAENSVGGRLLAPGSDPAAGLAMMLPIKSPFGLKGTTRRESMAHWLRVVSAMQPDIVLLDYGSEDQNQEDRDLLEALSQSALLIAAAGNKPLGVGYPARNPSVLAVGALTVDGELADYSEMAPEIAKPELLALGDLSETPFAPSLSRASVGTSFSALVAVAAATLVWATHPAADASWVRQVLIDTATPFEGSRVIQLEAALDRAREDRLLHVLDGGPLSLLEIVASMGWPQTLARDALDRLIQREAVTWSLAGPIELYEKL